MKQNLWKNRNFRLLFASASATNLGDGLNAVAVPWLATLLTHDPFLIGLVAAARHLPWFLFALPAGVLTDRLDHRRILISADCLRVALSLALLALALSATPGTTPVLIMAVLSFILGRAEVLRDNTAQTFLPSVVEKSQLEQANGALWSAEQLAGKFVGPPIAGLLISFSIWGACGPSGRRSRADRHNCTAPAHRSFAERPHACRFEAGAWLALERCHLAPACIGFRRFQLCRLRFFCCVRDLWPARSGA
jgi:MFS family permease